MVVFVETAKVKGNTLVNIATAQVFGNKKPSAATAAGPVIESPRVTREETSIPVRPAGGKVVHQRNDVLNVITGFENASGAMDDPMKTSISIPVEGDSTLPHRTEKCLAGPTWRIPAR
jgi:hypothetical protein